jgi:carbon monoxide dehydrogenase subunit G
MDLSHRFRVPASVEEAWTAFNHLDRIAPCFPGATITTVSGNDFEGSIKVKLGPVALFYNGSGRFIERDPDAHRVVIEAQGEDRRGNGTATARVTASFAGDEKSTDVEVLTALDITGKPAQFGPGVISDVSDKLLNQFASNVSGRLAEGLGTPVEMIEPIDSLGLLRPTPWADDEDDNETTIEMEAIRVPTDEPAASVADGRAEPPPAAEVPETEPAGVPEAEPAVVPGDADSLLAMLGPALRRYAPAIGFVFVAILVVIKMVNRRRHG